MMKNVSIRMDDAFLKEAERISRLGKTDKSLVMRKAFEKGMVGIKLETALELFVTEKVSTSEAASIAGLSTGEFMEEAAKRGIRQSLSVADLGDSLKTAVALVK